MMQKRRLFSMIIGLVMILGATACSDYRRAIGTEKSTPDEFQVVVRPPLSLPPEFTKRPDETTTDLGVDEKSSRNLMNNLFERRNITASGYDELFELSSIEPDIRVKVDQETTGIIFERRLPINVIFGGLPDVGPILDKMAEDRRIRINRMQKRAINEGATPAYDGVHGDEVQIQ
jgi:hypothetical protein